MKSRRKIVSDNSKLLIIVLGLLLIFVGNGFDVTFFKVDIDSLIVNVGALLLVIGTLQWLFDEGVRKEIVQEISLATLGTDRIYKSGISDCIENSKKIEEENIWRASSSLLIGVHYSNRFMEDNSDIVMDRINNKKYTSLFHIDEDSAAADYLRSSCSGTSDIGEKTKNMKSFIDVEFKSSAFVKVHVHKRVLRYSFIKTDQAIWVKFFTNSEGYSVVPAIKVDVGSPFFSFFNNDINELMEQSDELK